MERFLIINADDFGLCEGVNNGIAQAHTKGVLTSTTLMANMPLAADAVKIAKEFPNLGVGIHLNLTDGSPLSKEPVVSLLVDGKGQFKFKPNELAKKSILGFRFRKAIKTELSAQVQWAVEMGIKPTHLDSHKHIHSFPVIYPIVCSIARQFNIRAIRYTYEPPMVLDLPWPPIDKESRKRLRITRIMAKINRLQNPQFFKTKATFGIAHTGKIDLYFFNTLASAILPPVAEVMTHPGFLNGLDKIRTRLIEQRKVELTALCSEEVKKLFKVAGIKLIHYGQLQDT